MSVCQVSALPWLNECFLTLFNAATVFEVRCDYMIYDYDLLLIWTVFTMGGWFFWMDWAHLCYLGGKAELTTRSIQ